VEHLDLELTDGLSSFLNCGTDLRKEVYRRGVRLRENIHIIGGHARLRDENFFGAIDNEVAPRVIRTFIQVV